MNIIVGLHQGAHSHFLQHCWLAGSARFARTLCASPSANQPSAVRVDRHTHTHTHTYTHTHTRAFSSLRGVNTTKAISHAGWHATSCMACPTVCQTHIVGISHSMRCIHRSGTGLLARIFSFSKAYVTYRCITRQTHVKRTEPPSA